MSQLLNAMAAKSALTWNGAISNSTTGFGPGGSCLDYWTKAGTYSGRDQSLVDADMAKIFADDPKMALAIIFGLRLITRKPKDVEGIEESQTGYGRRDEFYKAMKWVVTNRPALLYANLHLIPVFGSWKDFFNEPFIDTLDRKQVFALVKDNLEDHLLLKYLPAYRSNPKVRSERDRKRSNWVKGLCHFLGLDKRNYQKLKSSGNAHTFQKQMSAQQWEAIDFNTIPGKAMLWATSRVNKKDQKTVFERHGQVERLKDWVSKQKSIKFTGYPYELIKAAQGKSLISKIIVDKQFETCLEPMRGHTLGNVLCALDVSGSMSWCEVAPGVTPLMVCLSMGLVFSALNTGYFKDAVAAFSNRSEVIKLKGDFSERLAQASNHQGMGGTNFQSLIGMLVDIRQKQPEIPVNEYPETLLVISDMQFNPVGGNVETNYQAAMRKLKEVGLGEIRIIWWFVNGAGTDFPSQLDDKGVYMIGGFDPVNLKALMGLNAEKKTFDAKEKLEETPLDGMKNFLSQPIFNLINYGE